MGYASISPMNSSQVLILQALSRLDRYNQGMTAAEIESAVPGASASNDNMGVGRNGPVPGSLYDLGYVTAERHDVDGRPTLLYKITHKGRKAAEIHRAFSKRSRTIPAEILDPVVIRFRPTRAYGIDVYTDEDLTEIRSMLSGAADDVSLDDLRQQIANRRKQGAYADPLGKVKRAARTTIQAFGPEGWAMAGLLSPAVLEILSDLARTGQVTSDEK